ncbi:MAG: ABC transporter permease [Gammaproteobacteria bacterium]|nr:ABC transporter permease [Gammaproteobacteria bacterium]
MNFTRHLWRQFKADKTLSAINIVGLTVAITCALVIFNYVSYHLSFDKFHQDSDRIHRLLTLDTNQPELAPVTMTTNALLPTIREVIPEVEAATRFLYSMAVSFRAEDRVHILSWAYLADPEFFQVFSFPLKNGISGEVLDSPNTVILSQGFATQMFGDEDPVGKTVRVFNRRDMRVVGILEDIPSNSHLQTDAIISIRPDPSWDAERAANQNSWLTISMNAYLKLHEGSDPVLVEEKIKQLMREREESGYITNEMQSLHDVHLHSSNIGPYEPDVGKEDVRKIYVLISVALLLLVIAACNFINLTTARAVSRAKEVGVRKIAGAHRWQLARQFLAESLTVVVAATVLSLCLIEVLSPWVAIEGIDHPLVYLFSDATRALIAFGTLASIAFLAAFYPALILSSQKTSTALKGNYARSTAGTVTRKSLIVVQFTISTTVVIALLVINAQIGFLQDQELGFEHEGVVHIGFGDMSMWENYGVLANELSGIPQIESFTTSSFLPSQGDWGRTEFTSLDGARAGSGVLLATFEANASFLRTYNTDLEMGRDFNDEMASTAQNPVIINQAAVSLYQWDDAPVGKTLRGRDGTDYTIVGVMADARFDGLQSVVEPLVMQYSREPTWIISARMNPENYAAGIAALQAAWEKVYPEYQFKYGNLSDNIAGLLGEEVEFAAQLFQSTFLAIFIACLGLYGHAVFSAHQSAREVGIRKVFGASAFDILRLMIKDYGLVILIANVIAWPIALYLLNLWLSEFSERIDPEIWYFLQAALIVVSLAALTVSVKMRQVMSTNPVKVLRYE